MKLSPQTRYAIRIISKLRLAPGALSMDALAEQTGIALRTVENIQAVLRRNNITVGKVGAGGGIRLALPLSQISLGQMIAMFDDTVALGVCRGERSNNCPRLRYCENSAVWGAISREIQNHLNTISLDTVFHRPPVNGLSF